LPWGCTRAQPREKASPLAAAKLIRAEYFPLTTVAKPTSTEMNLKTLQAEGVVRTTIIS
jgi:hypothetical protein